MNSLAKVQIPIEKIYLAINSAQVLNAQAIIQRNSVGGEANSVVNVSEYTAMNAAVKEVSDAVKAIEAARNRNTDFLRSSQFASLEIRCQSDRMIHLCFNMSIVSY